MKKKMKALACAVMMGAFGWFTPASAQDTSPSPSPSYDSGAAAADVVGALGGIERVLGITPRATYAVQQVAAARLCVRTAGCRATRAHLANAQRSLTRIVVLQPDNGPEFERIAAALRALDARLAHVEQTIAKAKSQHVCGDIVESMEASDASTQSLKLGVLKKCIERAIPDLTRLGLAAIDEGVAFTGTPHFIEVEPPLEIDGVWDGAGWGALAGMLAGGGITLAACGSRNESSTSVVDCTAPTVGIALASGVAGAGIGALIDWAN